MTIGENIRKYRKEKGLTQKELAERLGVSQAMITQYENGKRIPKIDTINNIAGALEMGIRRLYPDFSREEWETSDTFKRVQAQRKTDEIILNLLSSLYGNIEKVKDHLEKSAYDTYFKLTINEKEHILTREDLKIIGEYLGSTLPLLIDLLDKANH